MSGILKSLDGHADIPLDRALIIVGRYHRCDVRIDSHRISRHHCCLSPEECGVLVRDLDSTNGTYLNDRRIQQARMRAGDELKLAGLRYRLVADDQPGSTPHPQAEPAKSVIPEAQPEPALDDEEGIETSLDVSNSDRRESLSE